MLKTIFLLIAISSTATALKCYTAQLTITQPGQSEELPLNAQLEGGCIACQRIKVVTEAGPMGPMTIITWTCEIPRPMMMPPPMMCPGMTPPTLPPTTTPQTTPSKPMTEGGPVPPQICTEILTRTRMEMPVRTTSLVCGCCQDNCNRSPGCQLTQQDLMGVKALASTSATASSTTAASTTASSSTTAQGSTTVGVSSTTALAMTTLAELVATTTLRPSSKLDLEARKIATRCDALRLAADIVADVCGGADSAQATTTLANNASSTPGYTASIKPMGGYKAYNHHRH